jgi:hypothetical protein
MNDQPETAAAVTISLADAVSAVRDLNEYVVSLDRIGSRVGSGAAPAILLAYITDHDVTTRLTRLRRVIADATEAVIGSDEVERIAETADCYTDDWQDPRPALAGNQPRHQPSPPVSTDGEWEEHGDYLVRATPTYTLALTANRHAAHGALDATVHLGDGLRHTATFLTLTEIHTANTRDRHNGACLAGRYFWITNPVIVEHLDPDVIDETVADLVRTGEIHQAFHATHEWWPGLLPDTDLPVGFHYPPELRRIVDRGVLTFGTWTLLTNHALRWRHRDLALRRPHRTLIPFAHNGDTDELACFDTVTGRIILLHHYDSPDTPDHTTLATLYAWLHHTLDDLTAPD